MLLFLGSEAFSGAVTKRVRAGSDDSGSSWGEPGGVTSAARFMGRKARAGRVQTGWTSEVRRELGAFVFVFVFVFVFGARNGAAGSSGGHCMPLGGPRARQSHRTLTTHHLFVASSFPRVPRNGRRVPQARWPDAGVTGAAALVEPRRRHASMAGREKCVAGGTGAWATVQMQMQGGGGRAEGGGGEDGCLVARAGWQGWQGRAGRNRRRETAQCGRVRCRISAGGAGGGRPAARLCPTRPSSLSDVHYAHRHAAPATVQGPTPNQVTDEPIHMAAARARQSPP